MKVCGAHTDGAVSEKGTDEWGGIDLRRGSLCPLRAAPTNGLRRWTGQIGRRPVTEEEKAD